MSYLGNEPPQIAGYSTQTKAAPVGSSITLNQEGTVNSILLFLDGVRQTPTTDYTVSGTTLTLTSTAPTTAVATILFLGDVADIGTPSDDTVNVGQLDTTSTGTTGQFLKKSGAGAIDWADAAADTSGIEDDIALLGFKVASNGSWSKYNLVDQTEDAFVDQTGVDLPNSINEVYNIAGKYYTGRIAAPAGGAVTTYEDGGTDYVIHSFLSGTTNFAVEKAGTVDYLLVAGGGGGPTGGLGGGGGAGGMLTGTSLAVAIGEHPVAVGAGGPTWVSGAVVNGEDTTFSGLTAIGGGGGAGNPSASGNGGSGGGGHAYASAYGTGTAGQGNNGGAGAGGGGSYGAGGGGGAGGAGANGVSPNGGNGGVGLSNSLRTNTGVFYAGGGGGLPWTGSYGTGGNGGGGDAQSGTGESGAANTGGGGGGGNGGPGGTGGSGIAVLRFVADSMGPNYNNMTLVSAATTAETEPSTGDLVMTYTNGAGTTGVGSDLKAYCSRDNGGTYTEMTLVAQGSTGTSSPSFIVSAHNTDISGQPSGSQMKYKIETLNQSVSKETRIQAVSLGWA
jgi:hypothetical protein